jgi:hypothetical protein
MSGGKPRRVMLVLAAVVAIGGAQMAAAPALAGVGAVDCCANSCHKASPVRDAKRCCLHLQTSHPATLAHAIGAASSTTTVHAAASPDTILTAD